MNKFEKIRIDSVKPTILCIDDDAEIVATLTEILVRSGYSCECCSDARSALESVSRHTPDLMIVDVDLGEDDGLLLCEQIQTRHGMSEVPTLILSGAEIPGIVQRVRDAGGTYYLRKPFDPEVLLELIDKALWMPHIVKNRTRTSGPIIAPQDSPTATNIPLHFPLK